MEAVIRIKPKEARVWIVQKAKGYKIEWPTEMVDHLEVKDVTRAIEWLGGIWKELGFRKCRVVIILDPEAVFSKDAAQESDLQQFWEEVPLSVNKLEKRVVKTAVGVMGVAVNRDLYGVFVEVVRKAGGEVVAIVPVAGLESLLAAVDEGDMKQLKRLINAAQKMSKMVDFGRPVVAGRGRSNWYVWVAIGGVVMMLGGIGGWGILDMRYERGERREGTVEPTVVSTVEPSVTVVPTVSEEEVRQNLSIIVLNGSGIAGVAGEVREYLADLGYGLVEVGNALGNQDTTTLRLKLEMERYLSVVLADLEKGGYKVATASADLSNDFEYGAELILGIR
jgi:hypothetical protein